MNLRFDCAALPPKLGGEAAISVKELVGKAELFRTPSGEADKSAPGAAKST